jgi:hypothetical protein
MLLSAQRLSARGESMQGSGKRAFGRSLGDFRIEGKDTPHGLWPAEEKLLEATARGEACDIARKLPEEATDDNRVRGAFLRFLLLGGDENAPVHEKGVMLYRAYVDGDIDLESAPAAQPLTLAWCRIAGKLIGRNARLGRLILQGSHIRGIRCDGAKVMGSVFLYDGFAAEGEVRFHSAEVGGAFNCGNGTFKNPGSTALACDRAKMTGDVFLRNGFTAEGKVSFVGAEISGQFSCNKGTFKNPGGYAFDCSRIKVTGTVILGEGFTAEGEVRFLNAKIAGDMGCAGGSFKNEKAKSRRSDDVPLTAGDALNLGGSRISGILWLGPGAAPNNQQVVIEGSINLQSTHATVIVDDVKSWPTTSVNTEEHGALPCVIRLDGFTFDRFLGVAPTDAATRLKWLQRQPADHRGKNFRPQPFEQLAKVLRAMGHENDARLIAMYKQQYLQPQYLARTTWWRWPFVWLIGLLWGLFAGYGYRPHRLIVTLLALWLGCAAAYHLAAENGAFAPADAQVWTSDLRKTCEPNWTACADIADLIGFNALTYSADTLVPIIDLKQRATWSPRPGWVRALTWFETIAGSACIILLGAILGGLVKRD